MQTNVVFLGDGTETARAADEVVAEAEFRHARAVPEVEKRANTEIAASQQRLTQAEERAELVTSSAAEREKSYEALIAKLQDQVVKLEKRVAAGETREKEPIREIPQKKADSSTSFYDAEEDPKPPIIKPRFHYILADGDTDEEPSARAAEPVYELSKKRTTTATTTSTRTTTRTQPSSSSKSGNSLFSSPPQSSPNPLKRNPNGGPGGGGNDPGDGLGKGDQDPSDGKKKKKKDKRKPKKRKGNGDPDGGGDPPDPDGSDSEDDDSDGSDSEEGSEDSRPQFKIKEAEKVNFGYQPTAPQFRGWKNSFYQEIQSASGRRDNKALEWAKIPEHPETTLESCRKNPRNFLTLDRKMAKELTSISYGDLGRRITQYNEDALKETRTARGMELAFLFFKYFQASFGAQSLYGMQHLTSLKLKDGNLEFFQTNWHATLSALTIVPEDMWLEQLYYQQIRYHKGIAEDINHYDRLEDRPEHPDRSYKYLHDAVERFINRQNRLRAQKSLDQGMGLAQPNNPNHSLPIAEKGKDKEDRGIGKTKGKSKDNPSIGPKPKGKDGKSFESGAKGVKGKTKDKGKGKPKGKTNKGDKGNGKGKGEAKGGKQKSDLPCFQHQKGQCTMGDSCQYSHDVSAAPNASPSTQPGGKPPVRAAAALRICANRKFCADKPWRRNEARKMGRKWLCDTGCSYDVVNVEDLTQMERERTCTLTKKGALHFRCSKGNLNVKEECSSKLHHLKTWYTHSSAKLEKPTTKLLSYLSVIDVRC